jgi:hypothetical protein
MRIDGVPARLFIHLDISQGRASGGSFWAVLAAYDVTMSMGELVKNFALYAFPTTRVMTCSTATSKWPADHVGSCRQDRDSTSSGLAVSITVII